MPQSGATYLHSTHTRVLDCRRLAAGDCLCMHSSTSREACGACQPFPGCQAAVRDCYQSTLDMFPAAAVQCDFPVTVRIGYYFGFHDKCPFSPDDRILACQRALTPLRIPRPADEVEIRVFEDHKWTAYRPLARSCAWNWQQGAMLQWLGDSYHVIFNDFDGKNHIARVIDARTGSALYRLPFPIGAVSGDGTVAVTYNFVRANQCLPGYGYGHGSDSERIG